MIVDSSAIVALVQHEVTSDAIVRAFAAEPSAKISAPVWLETQIVLSSKRIGLTVAEVNSLAAQLGLDIVDFSPAHSAAAFEAWQHYGKGNHPAALNFADCMSYATAVLAGEPLLFVGDDFRQTDVAAALG